MVGLAAAETANPKKTLPKAIKQVFWRIFLFYILSLTFIGLIVPYDSEELLGSSAQYLHLRLLLQLKFVSSTHYLQSSTL